MSIQSFVRTPLARGLAVAMLVAVAVPAASVGPAQARAGGGFSFGSRGTRTFSMPAPTPTAPRYSQPFGRTEMPNAAAVAPRRFGFGTGLLAGLLGAGLFGSMFGGGFFYGIAALFGLLFKVALVGGLIWLVFRLVTRRGPALAGGPGVLARQGYGPLPGGAAGAAPRTGGAAVPIGPQDYADFEAALGAVQNAYSQEDLAALSRLATPEMVRHLGADLDGNRARGLRNDVSQTRLVRGDLSEAWSEGATHFATVAMRFSAVDVMVDRASGRIMSGDPVRPVEATELWTFRRDGGGAWRLSAIQQAG